MGDSSKNAVNLLRIEVGHPHTGQFKAGYLPKGTVRPVQGGCKYNNDNKNKDNETKKASNKHFSNVYSLRPVLGIII